MKKDKYRDEKYCRSFLKRSMAVIASFIIGVQSSYVTNLIYKKKNNHTLYEDILFNDDVYLDEVKDKIYSSEYLSDEFKDYLYNEQFFKDILPYVNEGRFIKFMFDKKLNNVRINMYDDSDNYGKNYGGYYNAWLINVLNIYINNKDILDTLSHEFIHMCQGYLEYNLICEASAEILSQEYFYGAKPNSYNTEVYLIKKLMEIIGPVPILKYVFSGYFEPVEIEVRKYLNNEEYNKFVSLLRMKNRHDSGYSKDKEDNNRGLLNEMLDLMFERKYGYPSGNDIVIQNLGNPNMSRYYFNSSKINQENSYIDVKEIIGVPIKEAFDSKLIDVIIKPKGIGAEFLKYEDLNDGSYSIFDKFYCISSEPVYILVHNGYLYACYDTYKREYIPTINDKFEENKILQK